ncbi:alpha-(1,3)-fucosyltransferase C-like isoform X1 [Mercenaria mercenaria]|uniref:alpha-(1,3)-fucosyltransferase C-like isoform X1 n=1 Tax=Mercenaria mercenaria TaxID=6596 RepID=UPI001E1D7797|nr:alpha-(1,3)-fucosyltransferase C-like isoform X1 [Mercenaria mercenaria]
MSSSFVTNWPNMNKKYLKIYLFGVWILVVAFGNNLLIQYFGKCIGLHKKETSTSSSSYMNKGNTTQRELNLKYFRITWYNVPQILNLRPEALYSGFERCNYSNCKMSFNKVDAGYSDAIIFHAGYKFPRKLSFKRPNGQVWIFYDHEPPYRYKTMRHRSLPNNSFNWTMTYDANVSDIHLPYGEITNKSYKVNSSEDVLMRSKNRTALLIMSHCNTPADRLRYVNQLKKFIDVDILGRCGTNWSCGILHKHDNCFEILNRYKFFLAFENSFCNNYFTEKVFDNFDYDTVLVTRGGNKGQINQILPDGTFISTDNFRNAKELGLYLKSIKDETYLNIIRRKQKFTSFKSYESVYQKAMCEICKRMNNAHIFKKTIKNINTWAFSSNPCIPPGDF